jgi:hypothetical protein
MPTDPKCTVFYSHQNKKMSYSWSGIYKMTRSVHIGHKILLKDY